MPIQTDAEKIQLMLETMGIADVEAAELAYDKVEKQIKSVETASRSLRQEIKESKATTYELVETEYQLVEAVNAETKALEALNPARLGGAQALENTVTPATEKAASSLEKLGRGTLAAEKAVNALATGTGLMRLGPALEGLTKIIGGPAGLGFAIGSMAVAVEGLIPHFLKWINADNAKHAKDIADALQKQADAADQIAQRPTKKEAERQADITQYLAETEGLRGGGLRAGLERAIRRDPNAMLTPDEIQQLQMQGAPGSEAAVRRRNEMIRRQQEQRITGRVNQLVGGVVGDDQLRLQAIDLAERQPGALPPGFAEAMRRAQAGEKIGPENVAAERDKAMQAQRAAEKEIEQGKEKEQERIKKEIHDRIAAKKHRDAQWQHGVDATARAEEQLQREAEQIAQQNAGKEMADRDKANREQKAADRLAARAARPENILSDREKAVKEAVTRAALANAPADFNPEMIAEWVRQALKDLPMQNNMIMPALNQAMWEVRMHIRHQAEMQKQQWDNMGGMQFWQGNGLFR